MINRERLVKTFCDLAIIDSPSGEEEEIAVHLVSCLKALELLVSRDSYGNVIASDGRKNPLMLSAHMDTVEPGRGVKPTVDGDRILSDGTTILGGDCKAGVSAILEALESLREDNVSHIPFEVVFTREEETGLVGARNLDFSMINSKESIVFDGEGPPSRITSASPTYIGFDVEIKGKAAHAGIEPEEGVSAIRAAVELISKLPQGRLDQDTTFNLGTIVGGTTRNTVPETVSFKGEFRSRNVETLDSVRMQLTEAVKHTRLISPETIIDIQIRTDFETYTLTDDDPATMRVKAAIKNIGLTPTMEPSGGGTDGNIFRRKGISAVVVGMADNNMHTVREYVSIPDLVDAAHLVEALLNV